MRQNETAGQDLHATSVRLSTINYTVTDPAVLAKTTAKCQKVSEKDGSQVLLEQWVLVKEEISISCECQILKNSKLKSLLLPQAKV